MFKHMGCYFQTYGMLCSNKLDVMFKHMGCYFKHGMLHSNIWDVMFKHMGCHFNHMGNMFALVATSILKKLNSLTLISHLFQNRSQCHFYYNGNGFVSY